MGESPEPGLNGPAIKLKSDELHPGVDDPFVDHYREDAVLYLCWRHAGAPARLVGSWPDQIRLPVDSVHLA